MLPLVLCASAFLSSSRFLVHLFPLVHAAVGEKCFAATSCMGQLRALRLFVCLTCMWHDIASQTHFDGCTLL